MNVQVVYCNHQTADLAVRERLAFSSEDIVLRAYDELRNRFPDSEHVLVSTCNRVELYSAQQQAERSPSHIELARFFSEFHSLPLDDIFSDLLEETGAQAVRHLFEVAASIDSMVLGENQIVSQVKEAYELARRGNANGPLTNALFQRALAVSARVRTETKLSEGRVSIASVAVGDFGRSIFERFDDKTVLVIGAGDMADETLRYLQNEGVGKIVVCNRTAERAERLAGEFGGTVRPWEQLDICLADADLIVSATGASEPVVSIERFQRARAKSGAKPVFILDLGAPRDFQPGVGHIDDGVFLYDIDDLEATCRKNREARATEIERAHAIIEQETARFVHELHHKATGPIIGRLRDHWHEISAAELEILFRKMSHLPDEDRRAIERTIERIVNKLLHPPLETLREESREGTPHGLLDAIRRLFHLGE
ncbi:MAG: glutamyl-tRNA reductase [Planctomycetota bacterium]|nr:MAG: glutamyl-tRNA reductase [Planctomycetota bacterium]REJ95296.1 MAG: glutamyl-tRNA reductase [Planctomycetota bacterium]REK24262.1 MAG: glutamyl-tRNA reductase [Planctomycetota bacterium]REK28753.1 MAG: glutamyl-tRNA reductase [Planctomycetota bacterium]